METKTKIKKAIKKAAPKTVSKPVKKAVAKAVKSEVKEAVVKTMRNRSGLHINNPRKVKSTEKGTGVKVSITGVDGKAAGNMTLPADIFGAQPNKALIAQAVRVYLANQRQGNASTQTRGEVIGSTRKIYRQKGTGRARHGALKAPLFVGGGVAHGPHPHDFSLEFPKKMRKAALISALSQKAAEGSVKIVDGEFTGKTKEVAKLLKSMELTVKGKASKVLFVTDGNANAYRGAHNLFGVEIETARTLTAYGVVVCKNLVFLKASVGELEKRLAKN